LIIVITSIMGQTASTLGTLVGYTDGRGFLKVTDKDITLDGKPIILRGAGLGGWSELESLSYHMG
jgi:hypothetical protein